MEQGHKVLFILVGLAILAALLGYNTFKPPAFIASPTRDPDELRLGMSEPNEGTVKGPWQLTANTPLCFPPPLQWLTTSTAMTGG